MATYAALEKRLARDVHQLHDYLWAAGTGIDGPKLLDDLLQDAKDLDAHLGARGKLRRLAEPLVEAARQDKGRGGVLFELLEETSGLTTAVERARRKDYRGAADAVRNAVESMSIGTCAAADCFDFVEEWESGKTDFETYVRKLSGFLEGRGVAGATHYRRLLLAVRGLGSEWDGAAPADQQAVAARTAIAGGVWCALSTNATRAALGSPRPFGGADFAKVLDLILARLQ
jgi:hypothetical protein